MSVNPSETQPGPARSPGNSLVWLGAGLPSLALLLWAAQFFAGVLVVPWYAPVLCTAGVLFLLLAVLRRPRWGRILGLLFFTLIAAGNWYLVLVLSRLPDYTGPIAAGSQFPSFTAQRADGTPFTQADLKGDRNTVLVFFRGRW
jgi:hypothetical protein